MDKLVEYAYDRFFLYDVLGYILPGTVVIVALLYVVGGLAQVWGRAERYTTSHLIAWLLAAYLAGLAVQQLGSIGGDDYFYTKPVQLFPGAKRDEEKARGSPIEVVRYYQTELSIHSTDRNEFVRTRLTRLHVLRNTHGNCATALFLCCSIFSIAGAVRYREARKRCSRSAHLPKSRAQVVVQTRLFLYALAALAMSYLFYAEHKRLLVRETLFALIVVGEIH